MYKVLKRMFLQPFEINRKSLVADIVAQDYRTADVFRKHGIGYCCGGKWPVEIACEMNGIDVNELQSELESVVRSKTVSNQLNFTDFDTNFIIDYILNVHHQFLKITMEGTQQILTEFVKEHSKKNPGLLKVLEQFEKLAEIILPAVQREEEVVFPYIRHIVHAHKHKETYAALLIRTMRKPVEESLVKGNEAITEIILEIRELTNRYTPPEKACISHRVVLSKLKELDNNLMQHFYLEQSILFPRALAIEKEVLNFL